MADIYQYPVFFECDSLLEDQVKKIETYFRVRRKSGGGDCGALRRVKTHTYSAAFKYEKDQQVVLQKYKHVVDGLVFTLRDSLDPHTSSPRQDLTAPVQQGRQSIPASTPPPSGEEYELQPDAYLLRYLKECPKARKELEKELSSLACSAQLYPEEGRVLVSRLAKPGAPHDVTNWKAEVDKLIDGYLCHCEVDVHKIKALLQSRSSPQTTDDVKVYSEDRMAVVVGERSQVKARLMAVEDLLVKRGSRFSGKETSIRRLGVAKFRLLWKKIEQGLQQDFPEVKFVQGAAGQLVLEGSAKEILKAGAWISDQEKFVFERTVSDMSPHFLAFLRKAYGGPGVLGDFLGVSDKVEVELRDIELCFFTLSSNNLDETEKALQAEIKEVKIDVPSCSVVPSELQEKLKSKTNEMNQRQYRAQVVFGSDSTVCLLGHTKEVEDLNEAVIQFILDHSSAQSIVHLPFKELPELPNSFFLRERVPVEPLGAEQYCRSPTEKDELLSVDRLLQGISTGNSTPGDHGFQMDATAQDKARGATAGAPGGGVHVKIIQGRVETQQVDALVSPMAGHDPLSTSVGNTLFKIVGSQLTAMFRKEAVEETWPGNTVLVEGLPELPSNAVFFLNLTPWDDDHDGTAVEVLKLGVNNILTSCEKRGFSSVALPVLGAGIRLRFPNSVVARVVLEEVHKFEQNRASRTPFLVSIVIHPDDEESSEAFKSARESSQLKGFTMDVHQVDQVSNTKRIILLGKTGCGKSNLANTMFGEKLFSTNHSPNSGTSKCQAETKCINGRSITLIDTPGFFDVGRSEQEMKPEIVRCITECAPGPHAFLIVLKVEKFTEQEKAVISKICQYFSEDALKYAVVVFTHGNQLPKGMTIEKFVSLNENLSDLVKKCGGRCHVVDNKYWKNKEKNYRSNQVQVEDLLDTIEKMVMENNGDIYTNKVFQEVEKQIRMAEERIKQNTSSGNMPLGEIRKQAKTIVSEKFLNQLVGTAVGALLGSFFGVAAMVRLVLIALKNNGGLMNVMKVIKVSNLGGGATVAGGEVAGLTVAGVVLGVVTTGIVAGGVMGGVIGYEAAEGSGSPMEATERAFDAVMHQGKAQLHKLP